MFSKASDANSNPIHRTITAINTFKPQSIHIHLVFVAVITYVFGTAMARFLPSKGRLGKILNPGPVSTSSAMLMPMLSMIGLINNPVTHVKSFFQRN
jgi:hypothetical protein